MPLTLTGACGNTSRIQATRDEPFVMDALHTCDGSSRRRSHGTDRRIRRLTHARGVVAASRSPSAHPLKMVSPLSCD
jgi:hypothetical protein